MSGLQEILVIVLIILAIFYLPRRAGMARDPHRIGPARKVPGRLRLAIVASAGWPLAAALLLRPWERGWMPFAAAGLLPVAAAWAGAWVITGFKKR